MKRKTMIISTVAMVMVLCGTIYLIQPPDELSTHMAKGIETKLDESQLISKEEYKEMNKIIADYNQGLVPESELAKAEKLLKKHPELKYENPKPYIGSDNSDLISKEEYKEMHKIIADYNQGLVPESELTKAEKLLKKHPELKYKNPVPYKQK